VGFVFTVVSVIGPVTLTQISLREVALFFQRKRMEGK